MMILIDRQQCEIPKMVGTFRPEARLTKHLGQVRAQYR